MPHSTRRIVVLACDEYAVSVRDVLGKCRTRDVAHARQAVMTLIREHAPHFSNARIGRMFGRDPTTVWFGVMRHKERMEKDEAARAIYAQLREKLVPSRDLEPHTSQGPQTPKTPKNTGIRLRPKTGRSLESVLDAMGI